MHSSILSIATTKGVDIVVFPPSPFLVPVNSVIQNSNVKVIN